MSVCPSRSRRVALAAVVALTAGAAPGCAPDGASPSPYSPALTEAPHVTRIRVITLATAPLRPAQRGRLARHGIRILTRVGSGRFVAAGDAAAFDAAADLLRAVETTAATAKLSPRLSQALALQSARGLRVWAMLADEPQDAELAALSALGATRRVGFAPLYALQLPDLDAVSRLAALELVRHVDLPPAPPKALLDQSRIQIGAEALQAFELAAGVPRYGLAGEGTVGGIWDPDGVEPTHGDLASRLLRFPRPEDASSLSHGTAVGSCLAGSGERSAQPPMPYRPYQLRGVAPRAKLAMYLASGDRDDKGQRTTFAEQYLEARQVYGIDVASFSFSHSSKARYDSVAANLDYLISGQGTSLPAPIPIAVAAANDGYRDGYGSVSSIASAKNTLTVGASTWPNGQLWGASSYGPTLDGRTKPEVMAPGCSVHGASRVELAELRLLSSTRKAPPLTWRFDDGAEGWSVEDHLDPLEARGGSLHTRTAGYLPRLLSPDKLFIDANTYDRVELRLAVERHHRARLWWLTDQQDKYHYSRRRTFLINGTGELTTYSVDVGADKDWKGVIRRLRLSIDTAGIALARPGNTYSPSCGTSMSTPIAAGGVLLLLERYRQLFRGATRPSPALLKALLIASARDMAGQAGANPDLGGAPTPYTAGPDHPTGFGEIDLGGAVKLLERSVKGPPAFVTGRIERGGQTVRLRLRPRAEALGSPLKVTLVWDDPAGEPGAKIALQNDLDLRAKTPAGGEFLPYVLSATSPQSAATTGVDRRNNVEQLRIIKLVEGDTFVEIHGHELARSPQRFVVIVSDPDALAEPLAMDADGDGAYGADDCDDTDPAVHPGRPEVPYNRKDDDCDPTTLDVPQRPDAATSADAGAAGDGSGAGSTSSGGCAIVEAGELHGFWLLLLALIVWRRRS
jgi:hypothetical protein